MSKEFLFTSESVSEGHPDKMADQVSDAVLDAIFAKDPYAKVACETLLTENLAVVAGELRTDASIPYEDVIRGCIQDIGYTDPAYGLDGGSCRVLLRLGRQSDNIAMGVDREEGEIGAGDQGLMFGYATTETPELMPLPIAMSHRLVERQAAVRKSGKLPWLRPDAKSQVTVRYSGGRPVEIAKVVLSTQHGPEVSNAEIRDAVIAEIIEPVISPRWRAADIQYLINPTGRFEIGGPKGDTGLTGRKIIVDTYGGSCPHGGGAFSGKDPTKVDRSATYMARYIAKNVVAAGMADQCTVQLAYAIGVIEPVSLMINMNGRGRFSEKAVEEAVRKIFKVTPRGIIDMLDLRRPIYRKTAAYGHFGRELPEFTWENRDRVDALRDWFGIKADAEAVIPQAI